MQKAHAELLCICLECVLSSVTYIIGGSGTVSRQNKTEKHVMERGTSQCTVSIGQHRDAQEVNGLCPICLETCTTVTLKLIKSKKSLGGDTVYKCKTETVKLFCSKFLNGGKRRKGKNRSKHQLEWLSFLLLSNRQEI